MVEKSELLRVTAFADLPDDQLAWFISQCEEQVLKPGDTYICQGDPAENMFVMLEGEFQARGEINGETFSFPIKAGEVTGLLPFSRMKRTPVTGRALGNGRLLRFPSAHFPELVQKMPELTTRLVGLMSDRIRETTRIEQQRDRLAHEHVHDERLRDRVAITYEAEAEDLTSEKIVEKVFATLPVP